MKMESLLQINSFLQVSGITPGRAVSILAGAVGLISIIIGGRALSRSWRIGAIVALAAGLAGIVLGVLHLAATTGGFGTGKGRAGAIVAIVIGLTGVALGGLALTRSWRVGGKK